MESLAQWVEGKRKGERLSLRAMASRTGLSHETIHEIINGQRPNPKTIRKLAKGFGGEALEIYLLGLANYTVNFSGLTPRMAEIMDRIKSFNNAELELILSFADFVTKISKERR